MSAELAIEARGLFKSFDGKPAVRGIDIAVPQGSIYGILGPNGAGKTTTLRMLLGIIEPDEGRRALLGHERPLEAARIVGYLPEERGLYPAMTARESIAFMGALRGLPLDVGRKRAEILLRENGLGDYVEKPIKSLSKGMAQTIQLFGTIVHKPKLVVLDEPFSGLDAINQGRLEHLIREEATAGTTVIFSTHVISHAERLCERIAIIASGRIRFEGLVAEARDRLRPHVRLRTRAGDGAWRRALPPGAASRDGYWEFELPETGIEPLLKALIDGGEEIADRGGVGRPALGVAAIKVDLAGLLPLAAPGLVVKRSGPVGRSSHRSRFARWRRWFASAGRSRPRLRAQSQAAPVGRAVRDAGQHHALGSPGCPRPADHSRTHTPPDGHGQAEPWCA